MWKHINGKVATAQTKKCPPPASASTPPTPPPLNAPQPRQKLPVAVGIWPFPRRPRSETKAARTCRFRTLQPWQALGEIWRDSRRMQRDSGDGGVCRVLRDHRKSSGQNRGASQNRRETLKVEVCPLVVLQHDPQKG